MKVQKDKRLLRKVNRAVIKSSLQIYISKARGIIKEEESCSSNSQTDSNAYLKYSQLHQKCLVLISPYL